MKQTLMAPDSILGDDTLYSLKESKLLHDSRLAGIRFQRPHSLRRLHYPYRVANDSGSGACISKSTKMETREKTNGPAIKPLRIDSMVLSALPLRLERMIVSLDLS